MMNGNTLGDAMLAAVNAVPDKTDRQALFRALGGAIVGHIQANAAVTVAAVVPAAIPVAVVPVTGIGATTAPSSATTSTGTIQ